MIEILEKLIGDAERGVQYTKNLLDERKITASKGRIYEITYLADRMSMLVSPTQHKVVNQCWVGLTELRRMLALDAKIAGYRYWASLEDILFVCDLREKGTVVKTDGPIGTWHVKVYKRSVDEFNKRVMIEPSITRKHIYKEEGQLFSHQSRERDNVDLVDLNHLFTISEVSES